MPNPTFYTVVEVADLLGCSQSNVRRHNHEGTMPKGWKVDHRLVFNRTEIDAWIPTRRKVGHPFTKDRA